jgi:tRNA(fMet)-specific endonuclease VapC
MSGSYLLDTNIIISLFADEPSVKNHLNHADAVFVPSIALGELYYGARKSSRIPENLAKIDGSSGFMVIRKIYGRLYPLP